MRDNQQLVSMAGSIIDFSKAEMSHIKDSEFLLSKIEIGKKIETLLGKVEQKLHPVIHAYSYPKGVLIKSGKISKGDNYKGLPYYILDFPRRFGEQGVFAFRTMFWWGNFYSATIHLSGEYLETRRYALASNLKTLRSSSAFICIHDSPWEYHYGIDNYLPASQLGNRALQSLFATKSFVKISFQWPLEAHRELPDLVSSAFGKIQDWITDQQLQNPV